MRADTIDFLITLNRKFYQTFGVQFSETRSRLQPGVLRSLERIAGFERVLDLGCGNGELAKSLQDTGFQGRYVGVDSSPELFSIAMNKVGNPRFHFILADLSKAEWLAALDYNSSAHSFDLGLMFAVLHHIPGVSLRRALLHQVHSILDTGAELILSVWDFLASERMRKRILPWESVGLNSDAVDPGDYLIDWRRGGQGHRYVHHFQIEELHDLTRACGFKAKQSFRSDGEGGNMGLYQILEKV
jgi:SAM-dependent methyltransferase